GWGVGRVGGGAGAGAGREVEVSVEAGPAEYHTAEIRLRRRRLGVLGAADQFARVEAYAGRIVRDADVRGDPPRPVLRLPPHRDEVSEGIGVTPRGPVLPRPARHAEIPRARDLRVIRRPREDPPGPGPPPPQLPSPHPPPLHD